MSVGHHRMIRAPLWPCRDFDDSFPELRAAARSSPRRLAIFFYRGAFALAIVRRTLNVFFVLVFAACYGAVMPLDKSRIQIVCVINPFRYHATNKSGWWGKRCPWEGCHYVWSGEFRSKSSHFTSQRLFSHQLSFRESKPGNNETNIGLSFSRCPGCACTDV
ncbi:hypothetical protein GGS26DRAFT_95143 [Hypomontagnella submonticulosa]|nr:hypothetical protein GGS26DRAFT_95143 [Hypomontagnella submonticulosa]